MFHDTRSKEKFHSAEILYGQPKHINEIKRNTEDDVK